MSTHHDPFENDLRALQRRELPMAWRDEILSAAATPAAPRPPTVPRWLVAGWSTAWAAILLLYVTTPAEPERPAAPTAARASEAPAMLQWKQRQAAMAALLAAN